MNNTNLVVAVACICGAATLLIEATSEPTSTKPSPTQLIASQLQVKEKSHAENLDQEISLRKMLTTSAPANKAPTTRVVANGPGASKFIKIKD